MGKCRQTACSTVEICDYVLKARTCKRRCQSGQNISEPQRSFSSRKPKQISHLFPPRSTRISNNKLYMRTIGHNIYPLAHELVCVLFRHNFSENGDQTFWSGICIYGWYCCCCFFVQLFSHRGWVAQSGKKKKKKKGKKVLCQGLNLINLSFSFFSSLLLLFFKKEKSCAPEHEPNPFEFGSREKKERQFLPNSVLLSKATTLLNIRRWTEWTHWREKIKNKIC